MSAAGPARQTLPAQRRLRAPGQFVRTREEGQRVACGVLILNWVASRDVATGLRLGVVSSRKIGPATVRNRARRLLREVFRRHQHEIDRPVDLVLVARNSIARKSYSEVERDFLKALRQQGLLKATP